MPQHTISQSRTEKILEMLLKRRIKPLVGRHQLVIYDRKYFITLPKIFQGAQMKSPH